jgi:hypothetical protein
MIVTIATQSCKLFSSCRIYCIGEPTTNQRGRIHGTARCRRTILFVVSRDFEAPSNRSLTLVGRLCTSASVSCQQLTCTSTDWVVVQSNPS